MQSGTSKAVFLSILIWGFLLKSPTIGQKTFRNTPIRKKTHIELAGYPGRDSVTVNEILKAGRIQSIDHRLTIIGFRYTLWGPCIGAGVYFNNSEKDRFRPEDREYLRFLRTNNQLLIDSITARDGSGSIVNLRSCAFMIVRSDY